VDITTATHRHQSTVRTTETHATSTSTPSRVSVT